MKNRDVVKAFLRRRSACGSNLQSSGTHLISYCTCIAQWAGNMLVINRTRYSTTTSKIQGYLNNEISFWDKSNIKCVDDIPKGTLQLFQTIPIINVEDLKEVV